MQILSYSHNISFNESQSPPADLRLEEAKLRHQHRRIRRVKKPIKLQFSRAHEMTPDLSQTNPSASTSNYLSREIFFVEGEDSVVNLENDSQGSSTIQTIVREFSQLRSEVQSKMQSASVPNVGKKLFTILNKNKLLRDRRMDKN